MPERRPFAIAVYKDDARRRMWMGFTTRQAAEAQRNREVAKGHKVSPVITLRHRG
jgi:hypothetical protein